MSGISQSRAVRLTRSPTNISITNQGAKPLPVGSGWVIVVRVLGVGFFTRKPAFLFIVHPTNGRGFAPAGAAMHSRAIDLFMERMPNKPYCSNNLVMGLVIRSKRDALTRTFIQHNPPLQVQALVIDLDRSDCFEAAEDANVCLPSLLVRNPETGHGHGIYVLETPVPISAKARMAPQRWLAGIERGYTRRLDGDRGYAGLVCRNPLQHPVIDTGRIYSLDELDSMLDFQDKAPFYEPRLESAVGRNVTMFDTARCWAYQSVYKYSAHSRFYEALLNRCREINGGFSPSLNDSEVRATAKSIAKWVWQRRGEFLSRRIVNRGAYGCDRSEAGIITATRRSSATQLKIESAIDQLIKNGKKATHADIAAACGISSKTVQRYFTRTQGHA